MSAQLTLQSVKTDVLSLDDMVTDLSAFQNRLEYVIWKDECDTFSFDVINLSPVIANTIRRIILDEVPTMAIDTVVVHENSSIIADEIFSHRLGLVPMNIDPRLFEYHEDGDKIHERNTVVFKLDVTAPATYSSSFNDEEPGWFYVYSRDIYWVPIGGQKDWLLKQEVRADMSSLPAPLDPDILLAKLAPGQRIFCEIYCHKGIGRMHAKFQPVGTAWYKMKTQIALDKDALLQHPEVNGDVDELVTKLHKVCPVNVFADVTRQLDIEDFSVRHPDRTEACTLCRECIAAFTDEQNQCGIRLELVKTHLVFTIESCSWYRARDIYLEALTVMQQKAALLKSSLKTGELVEE